MSRVRRRLPSTLLALVVAAAVSLALVTATGTLTPAVALAAGGHWVVNAADQAAVHVDSGTAQVDAVVDLPADAGDPLFALQGDQKGFVVARDRVTVFGRSTLTVDTSFPLEFDEVPVGIETVGGPYLVYRSTGTIVRLGLPPLSLPVGAPVGRPVWTDDGTVWMQRTDDGSLCAVRAGAAVLDCSAGAVPGEPGGLTVTGADPAFVGTRRDAAQVITTALGSPVALGADVAEAGLLADRDTEGRLAVVEPDVGRMVLTDTGGVPVGRAGEAAIPVDLGPGRFSSPVASNGIIAVLDVIGNRLLTFDATGRRIGEVALPPGAGEPTLSRGADGTIYVDDADGAGTHIVGADGTVTSVATGGRPSDTVAIAAPPERSSPVAPPPTQQAPGPSRPAPAPGPIPPGPGPPEGVVSPPQPIGRPVVPIAPPAPTGVTARVEGESIVVTWQAVDGGGRPVSYEVRANGDAPRPARATTLTVVDLPAGQPFRFTVRALAAGIPSAFSAASNEVTIVAGAPSPEGLAATITGSGSPTDFWTATWQEPPLRGGRLVGYRVFVRGTERDLVTATSYEVVVQDCEQTPFEVRTVTRDAQGREFEGEPASITINEDYDCTVNGAFTADVVDGVAEVRLSKDFTGNGWVAPPCSLSFNGVTRWTGTCQVNQYRGAEFARVVVEYDTTYDIVLTIEAPTPASRRSVTGPVTVTTGPAPGGDPGTDCTADPPPPGC